MKRAAPYFVSPALACIAVALFSCPARASVILNVPDLPSAGTARGFEFVSFQFDVYLVGIGDPVSDYSANVLANDHENFTFLYQPPCGGSGKGGGSPCRNPPPPVRMPGYTYRDTYTNVTSPPNLLDAIFVFSGADVAGIPLDVTVYDTGHHSVSLKDAAGNPVSLGSPLSNQLYTLELKTDSLAGSEVLLTEGPTVTAAPEPESYSLLVTALILPCFAMWRMKRRAPQH